VPSAMVQLRPGYPLSNDPWAVEGWDGFRVTITRIPRFMDSATHTFPARSCPDLAICWECHGGPAEPNGSYEPPGSQTIRASFSHENELAQPGYYRVEVDRKRLDGRIDRYGSCGHASLQPSPLRMKATAPGSGSRTAKQARRGLPHVESKTWSQATAEARDGPPTRPCISPSKAPNRLRAMVWNWRQPVGESMAERKGRTGAGPLGFH